MAALASNAALVLGLAISLYTIFSAAESWLTRQRGRRALLEGFRAELARLLQLTAIVAAKADGIGERMRNEGLSAADVRTDLAALRARVEHLTSRGHRWDPATLGPLLNRRQLAAYLRLVDGLDLYRTRLTLRTAEYEAAPDRDGTLTRFLASAGLVDDVEMRNRLADFERALRRRGIRS
jgi:hypothetical protein